MMKKTAVILLCIVLGCSAYGQNPLGKGDKIPDVELKSMINHTGSSGRLSDFKGKAIILDFWFIACGSCREAMPHLDSISKKYSDDVQLLLVTWEDKKKVEEFFRDNPIGRSVKFTQVVNDSTLKKMFPARGFPHQVWIDKAGVIRSINDGTQTAPANIENLISGQPLDIPEKADEMDINVAKAIEPQINYYYDQNKANILNYSYLSRYRKEFSGGIRIDFDTLNHVVRFQCRNVTFLDLYDRAYISLLGNSELHRPTRMIRRDGVQHNYKGDFINFTDIYCYDLIYRGNETPSGPWTFGKRMIKDLDNYFNVKSHLEKTETACYVLKETGKSGKRFEPLSGESLKPFILGEKLIPGQILRVNKSSAEVVQKALITYADKPLYIELTSRRKFSFECVWTPDDLKKINRQLSKFGLEIIIENRLRDVIIIEKNSE